MIRLIDVIKQLDEPNCVKVYNFLLEQNIKGLDFMVQLPVGEETEYTHELKPFTWNTYFGYPLGNSIHMLESDVLHQSLIYVTVIPFVHDEHRLLVTNAEHDKAVLAFIKDAEWKRLSHVLQVLMLVDTWKMLTPLHRAKLAGRKAC